MRCSLQDFSKVFEVGHYVTYISTIFTYTRRRMATVGDSLDLIATAPSYSVPTVVRGIMIRTLQQRIGQSRCELNMMSCTLRDFLLTVTFTAV